MSRGLDVGTSFLVASWYISEPNKKTGTGPGGSTMAFKSYRDAFLQVEKTPFAKNMLDKLSKASYIEVGDKIFILGDDAVNLATVFSKEVRRPLKKGVISPSERDAIVILKAIITDLLGKPEKPGERVVFSCPADPWDEDYNTVFHRGMFSKILSDAGFNPMPLNEGLAVVFSELANQDFTGIGISFGAGMVNVCLAYKSTEVLSFSIAKAGDYIDENAARSVGLITPKIMKIKESPDFDILHPQTLEEEAVSHYYKWLINTVAKGIESKLATVPATDFGRKIVVAVGGGTSKPKGVLSLVDSELKKVLPFEIEAVKHAEDPLMATARGCLIAAQAMKDD